MICKRCGNVNARNSRYCRHCGARLEQPAGVTPLPAEEFELQPTAAAEPAKHVEEVNRFLERAFGLSERDDLAGAAFLCTQAIDLDQDSISAHSLLGLLYERMGRTEEAVLEYERVVALNPNSAVDREHLQRLRGTDIPAPSPPARPGRSFSLFGQSAYLSAVPVVAAATLGIVFILLASRAAESGGRHGSRRAVSASQDPVARLIEVGAAHFQKGQYGLAEESFSAALVVDPGNADAKRWLARVEAQRFPRFAWAPQGPPQLVGPPPPPLSARAATPEPERPANGGVRVPPPPASVTVVPAVPAPLPQTLQDPSRPVQTERKPPTHPRAEPARDESPGMFTPQPEPSTDADPNPRQRARPPAPRMVIERRPAAPSAGTSAGGPSPEPTRPRSQSPKVADARELERQASLNYLDGKIAAATEQYRESVEASAADDPNVASRHQQLAFAHFTSRDYSAARSQYEKALKAYQGQLSKGIRTQEAQRGIRVCELGIRNCEKQAAH